MINFDVTSHTRGPSFKAHIGHTPVHRAGLRDLVLNNKTAFMRDFETLEFVRDYIIKTFPNGAKIDEFGCSLGQKPYSLLVMLDDFNKDKKYKITGYDFKEVLEQKKELPLFFIDYMVKHESVLFSDTKNLVKMDDKKAEELRQKFYKYFQKCEYKDLKTSKERQAYDLLKQPWGSVIKPQEQYTKDLINFVSGDINDISHFIKKGESNVVIFQNALYHMLGGTEIFERVSVSKLEKIFLLFKKINKSLSKDGIFVIGSLPIDHIYNDTMLKKCHYMYQNDKRIRVYDDSIIHKLLYKSGFKPIYYDKVPDGLIYCKISDVYLPSVWKKVRNIER